MKNNSKSIVLIACAAAVIGSFLPWASAQTIFGQIDVPGTAADGQLTIVLAVAAGLFCYFGQRKGLVVAMILCALGALINVIDIVSVNNKIDNTGNGVVVTVGYGLYLCLLGFAAGFFGLITIRRNLKVVETEPTHTWSAPQSV